MQLNMLDFVFSKGEIVDERRISACDQLRKQGIPRPDVCVDDLLCRLESFRDVDETDNEKAYRVESNLLVFHDRPVRIAIIPQGIHKGSVLDSDRYLAGVVREWESKMAATSGTET